MEEFETHPRGTGELLRQLRAEREALEALEVRCAEQRALLERAQKALAQHSGGVSVRAELYSDIAKHLKGTQ